MGTVTDGPPTKTVRKDADSKLKKKGRKAALEKEEEDDDKVFEFVKRFADEKHKKEVQTLENYQRKMKLDFDEKQQEYLDQRQKLPKAEEKPASRVSG